jgi:hypothetical protein
VSCSTRISPVVCSDPSGSTKTKASGWPSRKGRALRCPASLRLPLRRRGSHRRRRRRRVRPRVGPPRWHAGLRRPSTPASPGRRSRRVRNHGPKRHPPNPSRPPTVNPSPPPTVNPSPSPPADPSPPPGDHPSRPPPADRSRPPFAYPSPPPAANLCSRPVRHCGRRRQPDAREPARSRAWKPWERRFAPRPGGGGNARPRHRPPGVGRRCRPRRRHSAVTAPSWRRGPSSPG